MENCKDFPNCWEIKNCGRGKNGENVPSEGECRTSIENMGHSCWVVAGNLSEKAPDCPRVKKDGLQCCTCEVFKRYNRISGIEKGGVVRSFPEEEYKYSKYLEQRSKML